MKCITQTFFHSVIDIHIYIYESVFTYALIISSSLLSWLGKAKHKNWNLQRNRGKNLKRLKDMVSGQHIGNPGDGAGGPKKKKKKTK